MQQHRSSIHPLRLPRRRRILHQTTLLRPRRRRRRRLTPPLPNRNPSQRQRRTTLLPHLPHLQTPLLPKNLKQRPHRRRSHPNRRSNRYPRLSRRPHRTRFRRTQRYLSRLSRKSSPASFRTRIRSQFPLKPLLRQRLQSSRSRSSHRST